VLDRERFAALVPTDRDLAPDECAALARSVAELVDLSALERGAESFQLLWRNEHSEAWLNQQLENRDTGFHDHSGSCVGVHVLEGVARNEVLVIGGGARRISEYGAGESFSFHGSGIHRMEHDNGAVTIHVYSPAISAIGHYDVVDGALRRTPAPPNEGSPPSPGLTAALGAES